MSDLSPQARFKKHILPILQTHGKEIGVRSQEGDANCAKIISLYMMLYKLCDSVTLVLLEDALRRAGYEVPDHFGGAL